MNAIDPMFSSMVKQWRAMRKISQLELALNVGVSQRHLSFLESGRSKPSREMVLTLCGGLDLSLRDRNQLLTAAGYAPAFRERELGDKEMSIVNRALDMTLAHHEPYPAIVVDRSWNLLKSNVAADSLIGLLGDTEKRWQDIDPSGNRNIYRFTFHPRGMRPFIDNWALVAHHLHIRLQREVAVDPGNASLRSLLADFEEQLGNAGEQSKHSDMPAMERVPPVIGMALRIGSLSLQLFSMVSSFGTALDVTAEELRIETFFPADEETKLFFRQLPRLPTADSLPN